MQFINNSFLVVGLTGAPGAGKSTVAALFAAQNWQIIDADQLGRQALLDPEVSEKLVSHFGKKILDSRDLICRPSLADCVFNNTEERIWLEGVIHPIVAQQRQELRASAVERQMAGVIEDCALLFESGLADQCDRIVFVEAPFEQRLARVRGRGWDKQELVRRESTQLPLDKKRISAHHIVINNGDLQRLEAQVLNLLQIFSHI